MKSMIQFKENTLYSSQFDDIYYNPLKGIQESLYVFIEGSTIKESLLRYSKANLVETGFGTGLNFLLTWREIEKLKFPFHITYTSIEGFPLDKEILRKVYAQEIFSELVPYTHFLLEKYPEKPQLKKSLKFSFNKKLTLNLIFYPLDKATEFLPKEIHYWYLDGFSPQKNPEMWNGHLWKAMKDLSNSNSFATTFTASHIVKKGLEEANFNWKKIKGFANKRDRLVGYKGNFFSELAKNLQNSSINVLKTF